MQDGLNEDAYNIIKTLFNSFIYNIYRDWNGPWTEKIVPLYGADKKLLN